MQRARNTTINTILPQELLVLASSHEHYEMNRYRRLALRFLPFNAGISRLLEALATECEQRLHEMRVACERSGTPEPTLTVSPLRERYTDGSEKHFFVINVAMAATVLAEALNGEHQSLRFYRQLLASNATPELHPLIATFIKQSQVQCRILEESQGQWLMSAPGFSRSA
ncbi:hypothetical protein SAMN05661010_02207 [Modicisalibacter muralis]|uniref:DUF892 family protein n=1 Tax=Modicisalibacter muralis TaxID=119000 RepID=A0A1G9LQA2_9GAMM|nr:hypothetical protein [Halomonas muralis]SDL64108.1 hypothetical protein SAMN05661010_02207 [Halomonas muralis]